MPPIAQRLDPQPAQRKGIVLVSVLLVGVTWGVFWPVQGFEFLNYDDPDYVTANPMVARGLTLDGIRWAFSGAHAANWHPLTWISHMVDVELFGLDASGHHRVNLLIHSLNVLLVFCFFFRATGAWGGSLFVSLLFALHPTRVECVAWVAERKEVLSFFFGLLCLLAYLRWVERGGIWNFVAVWGALAAGLLSKPMLVTVPFILVLLDVWPLRRVSVWRESGEDGADRGRGSWKKILAEKVPLFLLVVVVSWVTVWAQSSGGALKALDSYSLGGRFAHSAVAYTHYLGTIFAPRGLSVFYPISPEQVTGFRVVLAGMFLVGGSVGAVIVSRRYPFGFVGWFWFLGALVPVVGIVRVGDQAWANRYLYYPAIGVFLVVTWIAKGFFGGLGSRGQWGLWMGAVLLVVLAGVGTRRELAYWQESRTLFSRAVEVTGENFVAQNNLASLALREGEFETAARHAREAIRIEPRVAEAHQNLGTASLKLGRVPEAVRSYREALRLRADLVAVHGLLGEALLQLKEYEAASVHLLKAVEAGVASRVGLASAYSKLGRTTEAIDELRRAVEENPKSVAAPFNLGVLLSREGRWSEAERAFESVLALDPADREAADRLQEVRRRGGLGNEN